MSDRYRRSFLSCCVTLCTLSAITIPTRGEPVSPEEARVKLLDKQKQRDAERSQPLTISAGELADLKSELAALRAEVARLRIQVAAAAPSTKPSGASAGAAAIAGKRYDKIDIGMTRAEVSAFIKQHAKEFAIAGMEVSKSALPSAAAAAKHETLDIDHFQSSRVAIGTHVSVGVTYTDYEWQTRKIGTIIVTLTDDMVTAISAR